MLSIDNSTLAVGTVASGAAAANVVYQHRKGISENIFKPVGRFVSKPFYSETYNSIGKQFDKLTSFYNKNGFKKTAGKLLDKSREYVVDTAKSSWAGLKKYGSSIIEKTNWKQTGKIAGIAAASAVAAILIKGIFDVVDYIKYLNGNKR